MPYAVQGAYLLAVKVQTGGLWEGAGMTNLSVRIHKVGFREGNCGFNSWLDQHKMVTRVHKDGSGSEQHDPSWSLT